jgi:tetratricopeptide (TPR) repeat protein
MKLFATLLLSCFSIFGTMAQEIFEDIKYEPSVIEYEGLNNAEIRSIADRAFENIKNYHNKSAQEAFDSILVKYKNNVLGIYGLAFCKYADGDYENAIEILNPLINVNPKNGALYSLRGRCNKALENLPNAIDDLRNAIEKGSIGLDNLSLSECLFYSGNFNDAVIEADNFIKNNPQKHEGYFVKGLAKAGLKDYTSAIVELEKAIGISPKNSNLYIQLTRVYIEMNELNKAVKMINRAIKLDVENAEAVQIRAKLKYELHDYTNAIFDCNRVVELGDSSAETFLIRGKSNLKIGLKKEACADFKKALTMGNKEAESLIAKSCN